MSREVTHARLIALHSDQASLVWEESGSSPPIWRHAGARVDPARLPPLSDLRAPATYSMDRDNPADIFPVGDLGSFAPPALQLRQSSGENIALHFSDCDVRSSQAGTLFELVDPSANIAVIIEMTAEPSGTFLIETAIENRSGSPVEIVRIASAALPLPADADRVLSWRGRHNAEFSECAEQMPQHGWYRETRRGLTGHGGPPGAYVLARNACFDSGLVYALQLAWSGDTRLSIERDDEGFWTMQAEAVLQPGEAFVEPGASFKAPPALLAVSTHGRNGAMAQMHGAARSRINWPDGEMRPRPVHLNSWEACYFAHDEARIAKLAEDAAAIGVERFVLDDGWFRGRGSDNAGLGDWTPDPKKYPQGLAPIAEKVRSLGMEFGLWVEPEMVNPDSDLYRAHPDWALALSGRDNPTARNQLVLDMRRREVRDYLFDCLDTLLTNAPISYLKWDHNRDHSPSGGAAQVRGSYDLFERVRAAHPHVEIESCAGGGGRIDAGILPFVHRFWASDNIDALARIPVQRSFLAWTPPETMGAHVGASPSHATGRTQSLGFRAAIACQGHFGVELDPAAMAETDREELAGWIEFYKRWRSVIHGGSTWLGEANDGILWQAQGNGEEAILWIIRSDHAQDRRAQPIPLPFAADRNWNIQLLKSAVSSGVLTPRSAPAFRAMREAPVEFTGSWLANAGLPIPALPAESALIFHLKATS